MEGSSDLVSGAALPSRLPLIGPQSPWPVHTRASALPSLVFSAHYGIQVAGSSSLPPPSFCRSPAARAAGPGWTANSTVTKLVTTSDGGVNVLLSPALSGCTSNSGDGSAFASIYPSHPGINRMKADLMAAYLTGGTVALYLTDSTCRVGESILGGW